MYRVITAHGTKDYPTREAYLVEKEQIRQALGDAATRLDAMKRELNSTKHFEREVERLRAAFIAGTLDVDQFVEQMDALPVPTKVLDE